MFQSLVKTFVTKFQKYSNFVILLEIFRILNVSRKIWKETRKLWEFPVFLWMLCKRVYQNSILEQYRPRKTYLRPLIATTMPLLHSNLEWPPFVYTINFEILHYIIFFKPLIDVNWCFIIKHFTTCYVQKFQFM